MFASHMNMTMNKHTRPDDIPEPSEGFDYWGKKPLDKIPKTPSSDIAFFDGGQWDTTSYGNYISIHYAIRRGTDLHRLNFGESQTPQEIDLLSFASQLDQVSATIHKLVEDNKSLKAQIATSTIKQPESRTLTINGHEVPEPMRVELELGTQYYEPQILSINKYIRWVWADGETNHRALQRGLIHLTKEAAIAHSEALLSFTTP